MPRRGRRGVEESAQQKRAEAPRIPEPPEAPRHRAPLRSRRTPERRHSGTRFGRCPNADSSMPPSCSRRCPTTSSSCCGSTPSFARYERNEVLFHQGDASHDLFVVQSGRIAIAAQAGDGRESVVAVLEAGGLFGELGLFDDAPRSADARALTDSSRRRARVRTRARGAAGAPRAAVGRSCASCRSDCGRPTRRSPTRCSSTCPAAPRSGCSSSPATTTSSRCRSPRRSWRRWSARRASGSTRRSRCSSGSAGSRSSAATTTASSTATTLEDRATL